MHTAGHKPAPWEPVGPRRPSNVAPYPRSIWEEEWLPVGLLDGKKALIFGVANDHSIAWGIARALHEQGAKVGFSSVESLLERRVRPHVARRLCPRARRLCLLAGRARPRGAARAAPGLVRFDTDLLRRREGR